MAIAAAQFTIRDENDITVGVTAPVNPVKDQMWLDTSLNPSVLKRYNGSTWDIVNEVLVGGRNLLKNTQDFLQNWSSYGSITKISNAYKNLTAYSTSTQWGRLQQNYNFEKGKKYTLSAYLKADNANVIVQCYSDNVTAGTFTNNVALEWTRYSFSFTAGNTSNSRINFESSNIDSIGGNLYVCGYKLEEGNKATDWTPAPEDVDKAIADIQTTTETNTTSINTIQGQISTLISNTTITTNGVTTQLKDAYNSTVNTVNSMSTTIGQHTSQINTANGNITSLNSNLASLQVTVNSINASLTSTSSTVASHTTQISTVTTTANTANSNVATLTTTVNTTISRVSSLELTTNGLTTRVGNTETAISSLQIGGRNLLLNSGNFTDITHWVGNGGSNLHVENKDGFNCLSATGSFRHDDVLLKNSTDYTYQCEIMFNADVAASASTPLHHWINVLNSGGDTGVDGSITIEGGDRTLLANTWNKIILHFKIKPTGVYYLRPFIYKSPFTETWWLKSIKLEIGNKATDWTPAPEDVDSSIAVVKDYATTTINSNVSTINQTTTSIQAQVTSLQSSVSTINTTLGNKADTTTVTAISNRTTTLESSVTGINASITTLNSNVSSVTTTANSALSAINNLSIGGRNLMLSDSYNLNNWIKANSGGFSSMTYSNYVSTVNLYGIGGWEHLYKQFTVISGKTYTFSFDYELTASANSGYFLVIATNIAPTSANNNLTNALNSLNINVTTTLVSKTRKYFTFTPTANTVYIDFSFGNIPDSNAFTFNFGKFKLEVGNIPTDWITAPEDTDSQITTINSSVTSLQSSVSVLQSQIALKVEQSNINTAVATLNGQITATNASITSLQTSINLQLSSITSKVSQTVSTKNLVNNAAFNNPLGIYWNTGTLVQCRIVDKTTYTGWGYGAAPVADNALAIRYDIGGDNYAVFEELYANVKPNTTYTISYYNVMNGYYTAGSSYVYAQTAAQIGTTSYTTPYAIGPDQTTAWIRKTSTITTGDNIVRLAFRFGFHSTDGLTEMLIAGLQIEEGSAATDWADSANSVVGTSIIQSPTNVMTAFNNISSYFQVNSSGATFGNISTGDYTVLGANGMKHHVGGTDYDYLYITYLQESTITFLDKTYTTH